MLRGPVHAHGKLRRLRVSHGVGQRLLQHSVGGAQDLARQVVIIAGELELAGQAAALGGSRHQPLDGGLEPEIVEHQRPQLRHQLAHRSRRAPEQVLELAEVLLGCRRIALEALARQTERVAQRGELLPELVVQLARDAHALALHHALDVREELAQRLRLFGHPVLELGGAARERQRLAEVVLEQEEAVMPERDVGHRDQQQETQRHRQVRRGQVDGMEDQKAAEKAEPLQRHEDGAASQREREVDGRTEQRVAEVELRSIEPTELARDVADEGHERREGRNQKGVVEAASQPAARQE